MIRDTHLLGDAGGGLAQRLVLQLGLLERAALDVHVAALRVPRELARLHQLPRPLPVGPRGIKFNSCAEVPCE